MSNDLSDLPRSAEELARQQRMIDLYRFTRLSDDDLYRTSHLSDMVLLSSQAGPS